MMSSVLSAMASMLTLCTSEGTLTIAVSDQANDSVSAAAKAICRLASKEEGSRSEGCEEVNSVRRQRDEACEGDRGIEVEAKAFRE